MKRFAVAARNTLRRLGTFALVLIAVSAGVLGAGVPASALVGGWAPENLTDVSVGAEHACATANGRAYCWGKNDAGQLGNGTYANANVPTQVTMSGELSGKYVTMVSAGLDYTCVVASGEVYCWGYNGNSNFGDGTVVNSSVPVKTVTAYGALAGQTVVSVSAGSYHTCAITESNRLACWGLGESGQLGRGSYTSSTTPVTVTTSGALSGRTIQKVSAGGYHTCVRASNQAYCWGYGANGRLGNNSTAYVASPSAVTTSTGLGGRSVTDISASRYAHTCAVASGRAYCWGDGSLGKLGVGNTNQYLTPVAVSTSGALNSKTVTGIATGYSFTCAVLSDGGASCWGYNGGDAANYGRLGNGTTNISYVPTMVDKSGESNGKNFTQVNGGDYNTCGIASNRLYCWGSDMYGLSATNGQFSPSLVPVQARWNAGLEQTAFRFYAPSTNSALPGSPYAVVNTPLALLTDDVPLRLRIGVQSGQNNGVPIDIFTNTANLKLQYAVKTQSTCVAQITGFSEVTNTTPISFSLYGGTTHGAPISVYSGQDPTGRPVQPMVYVANQGVISNPSTILAENMAIWDYSIIDNNAPTSTSYCLRLHHEDTPLTNYTAVAEIRTADPTALSLSFVDGASTTVSSPGATLSPTFVSDACQTTSGLLVNQDTLRLRINQTGAKGNWSLSVAPTDGPTALWTRSDGQARYDFNDSSGSPAGCGSGSDGDGFAGQMGVDLTNLMYQPQTQACVGGVFLGYQGEAKFSESVQALSILSVNDTAGSNCYRDVYGIGVSQTIPPSQVQGQYALDLTFTAVAQ
ncbi:hypothetical protein FJZ39_01630 [Candidatus Saccharibacteria bacterium]|nr:hypothetical protein [Candidatus Saccharibacteria bacterium]